MPTQALDGVITDYPSPKGHIGNAGKFANAMLNVGGTFASDLIPFSVSVEVGPNNGLNGDINVRINSSSEVDHRQNPMRS